MGHWVIGSRFDLGPPQSFVRGGLPRTPSWAARQDDAFRFAKLEEAKAYLTDMAAGPASLDDCGVFEVTPGGPPVLVWPK
jgi:hypothetical protein